MYCYRHCHCNRNHGNHHYKKCEKCSKEINVEVNCCCDKEKDRDLVRASAFRAVNTGSQTVLANTFVKVLFQVEQFDLANEYNPITSTFIPKTKGVYSIIGTIGFLPNDLSQSYRARVEIRVNGNPAIAIDNDFFAPINFINAVSVSTIVQLQAGDQVEIYAQSNVDGTIVSSEDGSHFEAARFPSPIK
ncbi:C1q-like domain-containing protein [Bacillus sp. C1]